MNESSESFEIPVIYKGQQLSFLSRLLIYGYSYKIEVDVAGSKILFEPDEERNYRAVLDPEQITRGGKVDIALLQAIAQEIESILK